MIAFSTLLIGMLLLVRSTVSEDERIITKRCSFDARCFCKQLVHDRSMYISDCSKIHLATIPPFPDNVTEIDLSRNDITRINIGIFKYNIHLEKIDLSHNKLYKLERESFTGLSNLDTLMVNNNKINETEKDAFRHLKKLKHLNVKKNSFNLVELNFSYISSLTTFKSDFSWKDPSISLQFRYTPNLKHLDVSGLTGNCLITTLTEATFEYLTRIQSIDISACRINFVYKGTFRNMRNLTYLDVSSNRCLKFRGVQNITHDLPHTSIKTLKIQKVHQTNELNTEVRVSHLENLQYTNLSELYIDSNRIQLFEPGALTMLPPSLHFVSAADNDFSPGSYYLDVMKIPVHILNISLIKSSHDPKDYLGESCEVRYQCFNTCNKLNQHVDAKYFNNHWASINNTFQHRFGFDANIEGNFLFLPFPRNITQLYFTNSNERFKIPPLYVTPNNVKLIDISYNILFSLIGPVLGLEGVEYMDMSNNFCSNLSKVFFTKFTSLKTLLLHNNLLGFILPTDLEGETLKYLAKLEILNLSENRIPMLPYKFFGSQKSIRRLIINGNMLDNITFKIGHLTKMELLDISNNRISYLDDGIRSQFENIFKHNAKMRLDLSGNYLLCTCDTIDFVAWIAINKIRFQNLHYTKCQLLQKGLQNLTEASLLHSILKKECSSYVALIIGMVVFAVLFTTVLCLGIVYRHRWKLRYVYYMVKSKYYGTITGPSGTDCRVYEYDAFISYDNKDRRFVTTTLLENLETNGGFRLCIHNRDFLPGHDIQSNIISAIHNSRKTVAIMTHNYLESAWCMFEYNMAKMESIYSRNKENILFLVFLEQIPPRDLPLFILEFVQSQSYIEYPNDQYGDQVFWDKIKQVLQP